MEVDVIVVGRGRDGGDGHGGRQRRGEKGRR